MSKRLSSYCRDYRPREPAYSRADWWAELASQVAVFVVFGIAWYVAVWFIFGGL